MKPRKAAPLVALLLAALLAAGCAERYESADEPRPYYGGGERDSPAACPGSESAGAPSIPANGEATEYECPSGTTTTHPTDEEANATAEAGGAGSGAVEESV